MEVYVLYFMLTTIIGYIYIRYAPIMESMQPIYIVYVGD